MRTRRTRSSGPWTMAVPLVGLSLAVAACGAGERSVADELPGVAYGASMEDYHEAFADVEPITLHAQTPGPQGSLVSAFLEGYFEAVSEWSDGKITFEVNYSNAVAPPAEIASAVQDGQLDIASALPTIDPDNFPATNAVIDLTFNASQAPLVGPLQLTGWLTEIATTVPDLDDEFKSQGLFPIVPVFHSGLDLLMCADSRDSLEDFDGSVVRVAARTQARQLEGLGLDPVSLDFTEVFEGLQRGVVNCAMAAPLTAQLGGLFEIAPHATIDPEVGFTSGTGSVVINRDVWDSLPLPARQLMHDRLDVYFARQLESTFESYVGMVEATSEQGGGIAPFSKDARAALQERNKEILAGARTSSVPAGADEFVDSVLDSSARWHELVTDDLDFPADLTPTEFVAWYEENTITAFDAFVERLFEETLNDRRPA